MALRVVELFAGVGGFRLGLERAGGFDIAWFNQWEPGTGANFEKGNKHQWAHKCYVANFHDDEPVDPSTNSDITKVAAKQIPDHDLLVGGFPCQDYSVAATLDKSHGLQGKKGVLWWEIDRIVRAKKPTHLLLENVDRLLRSPAKQRGRDFGILLSCLSRLGYVVEWRVINAAEYGFPQKRRRVFIFATRRKDLLGERLGKSAANPNYLTSAGFFAGAFPVKQEAVISQDPLPASIELPASLLEVSDAFDFHFQNSGVMVGRKIWTRKVFANGDEPIATLGSILSPCTDPQFIIPAENIDSPKGWKYMRSAKDEERTHKDGHKYRYQEGRMAFPDPPDQPARTILTGEGGLGASRSNHAVVDPASKEIRTLTPEECEALNGFPRGHTAMIPKRWRYFTMGNALVVGLVTRMGQRLNQLLDEVASPAATQTPLEPEAITTS